MINEPIKTKREGNKITKICVEDYYKMMNRIGEAEKRSAEKWNEIWGDDETCVILGTGTSQPCLTDAFDEEIGNNIAFMKAKLNANIKKHNLLCKIYNSWYKELATIDFEILNIEDLIKMDLAGIRRFNSDYLKGIEERLGIED
jgi:hypothetical protein